MPRTGQTAAPLHALIGAGQDKPDPQMSDNDWKIALIERTIGASRGNAARGRPVAPG